MMLRRALMTVSLSATLLVSCGGSSSGSNSAEQDSPAPSAECTDTPRPELGAPDGWVACVDSGLTPNLDDFAFENWGGPAQSASFTADTIVSIFGYENTCMPDTTGCIVYPAAQQWMDQMNAAIEGGRCEGMATLSQRLLEGRDLAGDLQTGASSTFDLSRDTDLVGGSIAKWWASQTFDAVRESTLPTRDWSPSRVVDEVVSALQSKSGPTLGLYGNDQAHAVTPVAVTTDGSGSFIIHVYDNNYPGRILPVSVDANAETWSYDMAAANAGEEAEIWEGGTGTLDLTLMDSREVATTAPWSDASETKGSTTVTVTTGGRSQVGLQIRAGSVTVNTGDRSTWVDGITVFPFLDGGGNSGVTIVVPKAMGKATVTPVVGPSGGTDRIPLVMTVDFPGRGSTQVQAELSDEELATLPDFTFEGDEADYSFEVDGDGEFDLEYAYGEEEADYDLSGDVTFRVDEGDDNTDLSLLDSDGNEVWQSEFDGEDDDGEYGSVDIAYDEDTGALEESTSEFESYDITDDAGDSTDDTSVDSTDTPDDASPTEATEPSDGAGSDTEAPAEADTSGSGDSATNTEDTTS